MITFSLQIAITICLLCFGALSLAIARHRGKLDPFHRAGWLLTGVAFSMHGFIKLCQNAFGYLALEAGKGTPVWDAYLRWAPVFDHSRTFLLVGLAVALLRMAFLGALPDRGFWRMAGAAMALGLGAGAFLGMLQGGLVRGVHYPAVAQWDVFELVLMLVALFGLLLNDRVDRLLWSALAVYAFSLSIGTFWFMVFASRDDPDLWTLPTWSMHAVRLVLRLVMIAFAVRWLVLSRRGVHVPGLLASFGGRPSLAS